jgi:CheY-like chemotaxis protein
VSVRTARSSGALEIEVKDDGAGIAPEFLPFVFERFRQGSVQDAARRGLGLGLAITRHIVELHGGTVTAASPGLGQGATFAVTLPGALREPPGGVRKRPRLASRSRASIPPAAADPLQGVRVLVVDDEADTRSVLRLSLEQAGATVDTGASITEARDAFRAARPDVLLCDINLGGEDGYALIRALRALPAGEGGDLPAIALTAYARSEDRARALAEGFDMLLAKPGPANLPALIAGLLDRGGAS